ncbi:MAG: transcriptional regulator, partial [Candidatus Bathyarchaeia archaeon]
SPESVRFWAVAVIVLVAFLAIMFIGAWIGWTMATTPPPKPIGEIEAEAEKTSEGAGETESKE